jgi:hypothetical protein
MAARLSARARFSGPPGIEVAFALGLSISVLLGSSARAGDEPSEIEVTTRLGESAGRRGEVVSIPYFVESNEAVQGFVFSIDFDEAVVEVVEVQEHFFVPGRGFWVWYAESVDNVPGGEGVDEGFVTGAGVFDFRTNDHVIPANTEGNPATIDFRIREDASGLSTRLVFRDGGRAGRAPGNPPIVNQITILGAGVTPVDTTSIIFIDAVLQILPDVSVFIRGDSNGDGDVNLSDAQFTLGYLFLGDAQPTCMDAADADDDGGVNITDAVATLRSLFLGGGSLAPPSATPGFDPTPDDLDCLGI